MCTVTININEAQARRFNPALKDMEAISRWAQRIIDDILADNHISHSRKEQLKPYTIEEIYDMVAESEADIAAGRTVSHEEMMRQWEEELAREEQLEMAEAI